MNNWICSKEYADLKPICHYGRQLKEKPVQNPFIKNVHTLYRKTFELENIRLTEINITADDYYILFVNGKFVTQGPANNYHFVYNINSVDITPFLKKGKNVIAVDTLYNGYINRAYNSGDNRMGMYAEVVSNGELLFNTDETWKYSFDKSFIDTDITFGYETQTAELRDMNLYPHGWNSEDFDDSLWENAVIKKDDDHELAEQITPNVESKIVTAQKVINIEKKHFILDFGKELAGQLVIDVKGTKGNKIHTYFGEELNNDGSVRYDMRCNCKYEEYIILSGEVDHIVNFEYKAFRYIEIITEDDAVTPETIRVLKRNYPVKREMDFNCNVKLIEDIWEICKNAAIISSQESFLDCPSREKGQYLGDMLITSLTHSYVTGDTRLYKKAIIDFAQSSFIDKGLLAVVPGNFMQEIADFSLLYPQILLNYYNLSGDKPLVNQILPIAEEIVEYFSKFERDDGLLETVNCKWNLVDWPQNLRDDYDFELTQPTVGKGCHNVINAYYYGALNTLNKLRVSLGYEEKYDTSRLLKSYKNVFFRPEQNLFADSDVSQHCSFHSNVLPMYFEMCDSDVSLTIADFIMKKGLCCGVFFSYFALKALANNGYYDRVYELITNDSIHSWKNMLDEGATCTFEAWGKDQKWNTSLCHPWGSAPIPIIIEDLLGYKFKKGKPVKEEEHLPEGVKMLIGRGLLS